MTPLKSAIRNDEIILAPETKRKRDARVVRAQIIALSASADGYRRQNNVISLGEGTRA